MSSCSLLVVSVIVMAVSAAGCSADRDISTPASAAGCSVPGDISTQLVGSWVFHDAAEDTVVVMHFKPDLTGGQAYAGKGTALGSRFTYSIRDGIISILLTDLTGPPQSATLEQDRLRVVMAPDQTIVLQRLDDGVPELLRRPDEAHVRQWAAALERELVE